MTCSSSVGLVIRCNITPRHSSNVRSEDKLSVVILMYGDMVGRTGARVPRGGYALDTVHIHYDVYVCPKVSFHFISNKQQRARNRFLARPLKVTLLVTVRSMLYRTVVLSVYNYNIDVLW